MDINYDTDGLLASSGDEAITIASTSQSTVTSVLPVTNVPPLDNNMKNIPSTSNARIIVNDGNVQRNGKRAATSPKISKEKKTKNEGNLRLLVCRNSAIDQDFMDFLMSELATLQDLIPPNTDQAKFVGFGFSGGDLWIEAADTFSLEWLTCSLNQLSSASFKFKFTVKNFVSPPALQRFVGVFPRYIRERLRPDDVLRNIARLNPGLNTQFWRIFSLNRERSDGRRFIVFGIDDNSSQLLSKSDFKIFYRFTQITLKLSEPKKKDC